MAGLRTATDRALTVVARLALRGFFRRVEVDGLEHVPRDRPLLVVANHFNGFVDPVMLMRVFGRLPRFLARSTLWNTRLLRPFLWIAGMIPVYRPQDHVDMSHNREMFAACHDVLGDRGMIGIFPEGVTHDGPAIQSVHTGAARIAVGAHDAGVSGIVVVPVGLVFDDKIALRSRVLGRVGRPIDVDVAIERLRQDHAGHHPGRRTQIRKLTTQIGERLREVAPDFQDVREARGLRRTAEVVLRTGRSSHRSVTLAEQDVLAHRLAAATQPDRQAVMDALANYVLDLDIAGLHDEQVETGRRGRSLLLATIRATVLLTLGAPFALVGASWNILPYWIVRLVGAMVVNPVTKGTARLATALVVFPLAWIAVALLDEFHGMVADVAVFVVAPILGIVAVTWFEALVGVIRDWRWWETVSERRALLPAVRASRARLVATVRGVVPTDDAATRP